MIVLSILVIIAPLVLIMVAFNITPDHGRFINPDYDRFITPDHDRFMIITQTDHDRFIIV